jgi:hypothetical protein
MCCVRLSFLFSGIANYLSAPEQTERLIGPSKNQHCDYSPPQLGSSLSEPLVIHKPCGHADLSPHGATELVHAVKACIGAPLQPDTATDLLDIVSEVLGSVGFNLAQALTDFGPLIQQWCPIFVEDHILGSCDYKVSEPVDARQGPRDPVLFLCLWLVLRKPCSPQEHMGTSELYAALKQVQALLQSSTSLDLNVLQMGLIIAIYELGEFTKRVRS